MMSRKRSSSRSASRSWRSRAAWPATRFGLGIAAVGCIDLLATALIAIAQTKGDLSVVSVLGGMYPVATVLLAALVLHERVRSLQVVGIVLALGGVGAVAAG
jgi:drug/metabolite transporter (DMT)-like permease